MAFYPVCVCGCVFVCVRELLTLALFRGPRYLYRNMYITNFHPIGGSDVDENFSRSECVLI